MKHKNKTFPRLMALFLTVVLLLGMFPGSVFAAAPDASSTAATTETVTPTQPQEKPSEAATVPNETVEPTEGTEPSEDATIPAETVEPTVAQTEPSEEPTAPAETTEPTAAETEPTEESTVPSEAVTEPITEETQSEDDPIEVLSAPVALDTHADYIDNYFALLHAQQGDVEYHFLTKDADYHNPQIHAYSFEVDPDLETLGFEIRLDGVTYHKDPIVYPGGQLEIRVKNQFLNSTSETIQVFDIWDNSWTPITLDYFEVDGDTASIGFWVPNINSRFAIVDIPADFPDIALYDVDYGSSLGADVSMRCNNKPHWVIQGRNPYGFGNSSNGTFDVHLVKRPSTDPGGKLVGYQDYVAAGCLEYWKGAPSITSGQIVNVNYAGHIGGWKDLSPSQRRQIVGYMLYGVRYLSDGSFPAKGTPSSSNSTNPAVNMAYAQQILVWSAVKGVDPNTALGYYGNDVPSYGRQIQELANLNPERYDYDETLMLVGEGGSKQDLCLVLQPKTNAPPPPPPTGDIVVDKRTVGSNDPAGWKMELYSSWPDAQNAVNPITSAMTDGSGRAAFHGVLNGTYYVREAPAARQNKGNYWTLSDQILTANVSSNTVNVGTITNTYTRFRLRKISQCSEAVQQQIAGNAMYSLAGAQYRVSINGQQQEILTTDASGNAYSSRTYPTNTKLEVQEIQAPPGYKLNSEVYKIRIQPGDNYLEVADEPVFDPPFAITKVDKSTSTPQGDGSFSGAIFKWEYFDNSTWSGTPKRTWYFKTDAKGISEYKSSYLAPGYSSDPLYVDNSGRYDIPLGTVTMTEIQNSLGYLILPQPIRCSIVEDPASPAGAKHVFTPESLKFIKDISSGNVGIYEPINVNLFGSFSLDKVDAVTGAVPQGDADLSAKFQVVNNSANPVQIDGFATAAPGEVCYEFTTDASGHFTSGKVFPLGKYTITEVEAPSGYQLNTEWSQSFAVTEQELEFDFTLTSGLACPDDPDLSGSFSMDKLDAESGAVPQGDAALEGAEFELINNSKNAIIKICPLCLSDFNDHLLTRATLEEAGASSDGDILNEHLYQMVLILSKGSWEAHSVLERNRSQYSETPSKKTWWTEEYKQARTYLYGSKTKKARPELAYSLMNSEASAGNALALHDLAKMHMAGLGCEQDYALAQKLFMNAYNGFISQVQHEKDPSYLQYRIGKLFLQGYGVEKDNAAAAEWLEKSSSAGNPYAAYSLAGLYRRGQGIEPDEEKAFDLYKIAATHSRSPNAYAAYELGNMCKNGNGTERNLEEANQWYQKAYEGFLKLEQSTVDDTLLYRMGQMNQKGMGTAVDITKAIFYYEKAANLKNINALYGLGMLYLNPSLAEYDPQKAVSYLQDAAELDNQFAQYQLGKLYLAGEHIAQNTQAAVNLFAAAAENGSDMAMYQLGKIFYLGELVPQNIQRAMKYLEESSRHNNSSAMALLGKIYLTDQNVKNHRKGITLLEKAAALNNSAAQYQLGKTLYYEKQNHAQALFYLRKAADQDHAGAMALLGKILITEGQAQDIETGIDLLLKVKSQENTGCKELLAEIKQNKKKYADIAEHYQSRADRLKYDSAEQSEAVRFRQMWHNQLEAERYLKKQIKAQRRDARSQKSNGKETQNCR